MYLCVPLHGSPNTELLANNEHDFLPLQNALIKATELQKQKSKNNKSMNESVSQLMDQSMRKTNNE